MRRLLLVFAVVMVALSPVLSHADERAPLGKGDVALKVGYISYSDAPDNANDGSYLGLAGYARVASNVYLGAEVASTSSDELLSSSETALVPIEVNVKYGGEVLSNLVVDAGGGLSYSYASFEVDYLFSPDREEDGWLVGGQVFGDLVYKIKWFTLGINAKYQITEELDAVGFDFSNYRVGFQLGATF